MNRNFDTVNQSQKHSISSYLFEQQAWLQVAHPEQCDRRIETPLAAWTGCCADARRNGGTAALSNDVSVRSSPPL